MTHPWVIYPAVLVLAAYLGLYVAFFVTARMLVQMGEKDRLAPWLAGYLPLLICAVVGAALLWRAERRGLA